MGGVINIVTKRGEGRLPRPVSAGIWVPSRRCARAAPYQESRDSSTTAFAVPLGHLQLSAVNYRRGATERDSFVIGGIGAHRWISRVMVDLDFTMRWMNSDTQLDNVSATFPADVYGRRCAVSSMYSVGSGEQPITGWWSQKLILARSQEAPAVSAGDCTASLVDGFISTPFGSPNETRVLSNRLEWQHNFQVTKLLLLSAGYQFREQQGETTLA